ncbi:MAG: hypothetical protein GWN53_04390 [Gammaproteobacteria bacterium]|nr:hypothetical protein [Gammaproteobacteria bacterium]
MSEDIWSDTQIERCHECGRTVDWGVILTGRPGAPNYILGDCGCGRETWRNVEQSDGRWERYEYRGES